MLKFTAIFAAAVLALPAISAAQVRRAVAPIPGLACMSLNMTQQQAMDPSFIVPFRSEPSANASAVGRASAIVIVRDPKVETNGFLAVIQFNGHPGWIAASDVVPWKNPGGNGQRCIPSRMSDGSVGFAFH